ncbi:NADH dehydrogenase [ubiquinone] 1 beta subcomplex subunit 9 [Mucor velutinosus]|uniref:NADH dehydrogenase [ubiquinone] 1 beta subcomplex subunit 9 n=1 Tax=Mucor velutinosus TaxID=708070 RepID=A0AAN7HWU9_9FUNG|nr:NADH dehydrogenase [ubiquinone] 1 beta subcomplex subunit 9 [Mucor velutinosus]
MSLIKAFGSLTIQSRSYVSARVLHPKQFTSILQDVPVRPRSGWQLYMNENLRNFKDPSNNNKVDLKKAMQELSASWKAMPEAQKKVYNEKFEAAAKLHDDSKTKALLNATSKQIKEENGLRRKYNLPLLRDPRQPKRSKNSFLLYLDHLKATDDPFIRKSYGKDMVVEAGKKYRALSEAEKNVYREQAKAIQDKYNQEMHKYYVENGLRNE